MGDIYSWILSPEIRDYLRTARPLTTEEKAGIVDSGCRSIAEKYAALTALLRKTGNRDDKALLTDILRIYDWAFEELHGQRPEQVFIFQGHREWDGVWDLGPCGVEGASRTYEGLAGYLKACEERCQDRPLGHPNGAGFEGHVEKWAEADGKMQSVLGLDIFWWIERSSSRTSTPGIWMMSLRADIKGKRSAAKRYVFTTAGQAVQRFLCRSIRGTWSG